MRVAISVVVVLLTCVCVATGCTRPCENALNCQRTCSCVSTTTGAEVDCTMAYVCDKKDRICEDAFNTQTCNDMCTQYAKPDKCGFERCNIDDDCTKNLSCPILDANGNPTAQSFDCKLTFACDPQSGLCDATSTGSTDQLCVICRQQAAAGG